MGMSKLSSSDALALLGIAATIVCVVLDKAGTVKGPMLYGLLGIAAALAVPLAFNNPWVLGASSGMVKFPRVMLLVSLIAVVYSLFALWISPKETLRRSGQYPLRLAAFCFREPHPSKSNYDGIVWEKNYVDVRTRITNEGDKTVHDLHLTIQPETQVVKVLQVSHIPDIVLQPWMGAVAMVAAQVVLENDKGNRASVPLSFSGPGVSAPAYDLFCPRLVPGNNVDLVMACAALNPMEQDGRFPKHLFAERREPKWVRIRGTYEIQDANGTTKYQDNVEIPLKD